MKYARDVEGFSASLEKQYALSRDATVSCISDLPHRWSGHHYRHTSNCALVTLILKIVGRSIQMEGTFLLPAYFRLS